jgi:predicted component of type VI protein secretion system
VCILDVDLKVRKMSQISFADIVDEIHELPLSLLERLEQLVKLQKVIARRAELRTAIDNSMMEYEAGNTVALHSIDDIKKMFDSINEDND